ncbi:unnamed protein product [Prorocentrum cordatum]|uniref:Uncharacterized protein n=1 Tax=Prorocentrum cordatum TaxID=2364126 RepID=A0ABN9UV43_9DINO|nr:unnamed protein product [Polarella glacialis]
MLAGAVPSAQRIAQIVRSQEQDLALRAQQRRLADAAACLPGVTTLLAGSAGGAVSLVAQLAERLAVLVAGVQQRCEAERQGVERRLEDVERRLEARLAACERTGLAEGAGPGPLGLREVQAAVDAALLGAEGRWSELLAELRGELRAELGGRADELAEGARLQAARLAQAEAALDSTAAAVKGHGHSLEQSAGLLREHEERLQDLLAGLEHERALGLDQLGGAVANLERCLDELWGASEAELQRLRLDLEALRRRSADGLLGLRDDVLRLVEARLEAELAHLRAELRGARRPAAAAAPPPPPPERRRCDDDGGAAGALARELGRRLEDAEARLSALRVRVDGQDGRLAGLLERAEAAGQQAQDAARQASLQQREDILAETDCQLRIVRQRVDTLGELCEELLRLGPEEELAPVHRRAARSSLLLR